MEMLIVVKESQKSLKRPLELMEVHVSEAPPECNDSLWKHSYNYILVVVILLISGVVMYKIIN